MQEIADALQGTEKTVLVKNPVNPDLALWLGGIERLYTAGVKNLGAIHRGFSTYEKSKYRNIPEWQLAIEFQNKFPDLPLINDPSHITGKRDMIFDISQTALDLNFDGLMIETHYDPKNAWSDAAQQVTPASLVQIMKDLKIRKESNAEAEYTSALNNLRAQIDIVDNQIIDLLGKRMKSSDSIGELKKQKNVAVLQSKRWNEILGKMVLEGEAKGLSEEFILRMFKAIHQESINHQEKILNH
jgi:chorismate mutase